MNPIHPEVEALFSAELQAGEHPAWSGAPNPGRISLRALPLALFAIPWTAFAVFWMFMAGGLGNQVGGRGGSGFSLAGLPFVLVGLGLLMSPIWMRRSARRTGYFITNRRALIIEKRLVGGYRVRSFFPREFGTLERVQRANGSGDIILARDISAGGSNGNPVRRVGFFGVPDAREVEALLMDLAGPSRGNQP